MGVQKASTETEPDYDPASLQNQFLASLNHEIRTPLTGILGMTHLLLETQLDKEQKDFVEVVRTCAEDLMALFDKILEYSELASGQVVPAHREFHLPETVRGVVSVYAARARAKGLRLQCRMAPNLPTIAIGDAARLQRILVHILENALKFTEHGEIDVAAGGRVEGDSFELQLQIRDTGIGIPAAKVPAVFESFRQLDGGLARRYSGLGLGLSVVERLTVLMGGSVQVQSQPGRGSLFSVVIPLGVPV